MKRLLQENAYIINNFYQFQNKNYEAQTLILNYILSTDLGIRFHSNWIRDSILQVGVYKIEDT